MDISLVAPELQSGVRKMPPVPYRSAFGRRLIQALLGLAPIPKLDGVEIKVVDGVRPGAS